MFPKELRAKKQWVCWRLEPDKDGGRPRKVPINPLTGKGAMSNNPGTWTDYATAVDAAERYGYTGIGYAYFSPEMGSLLKEYQRECAWEASAYENRKLTADDYVFRRHGTRLPMTPTTFTWRFKLIVKKYGLPEKLNVHSLRHPNVKLKTKTFFDFCEIF